MLECILISSDVLWYFWDDAMTLLYPVPSCTNNRFCQLPNITKWPIPITDLMLLFYSISTCFMQYWNIFPRLYPNSISISSNYRCFKNVADKPISAINWCITSTISASFRYTHTARYVRYILYWIIMLYYTMVLCLMNSVVHYSHCNWNIVQKELFTKIMSLVVSDLASEKEVGKLGLAAVWQVLYSPQSTKRRRVYSNCSVAKSLDGYLFLI